MCSPGAASKSQLCNADKQLSLKLTFIPKTSPHHISRVFAPYHIVNRALPSPASSRTLQVHHSNASLDPDWRRPDHSRNAAFESPLAGATAQSVGNASPAMNQILSGIIAKDKHVAANAFDSMCVKSESVSNEIDESNSQSEKHSEHRI
jgi:hypothetical protein